MRRFCSALLFLLLVPGSAQAWWNEGWSYRKLITLDTSPVAANLEEEVAGVPVLLRLHTGNFGYFLDLQTRGEDLRFIAADDVTPLNFHIEKFDPVNEMALIWVQVPKLAPSGSTQIWMYYGNPDAVAAENPAGTYDTARVLSYHFSADGSSAPRDSTAYENNAVLAGAEISNTTLIGSGLSLAGDGGLTVPDSQSLWFDPENGWTWSAWLKIDSSQKEAYALERSGEFGKLIVGIDGVAPFARYAGGAGEILETPIEGSLELGRWHHVALVLAPQKMSMYIDGVETSSVEAELPPMQGDLLIGADADGQHPFVGSIDEVTVSSVARTRAWLQAMVESQGQSGKLVVYGEDASQDSSSESAETSYFVVTLKNVTVDGWVVIVILAVMAAISWVVMASKGMLLNRIRKDNSLFQARFSELSSGNVDGLDEEDSEEARELMASPLLLALSGKHEHFESSTIYRIYHAGVHEMHQRMPRSAGAQGVAQQLELSPQAINAIRATMDGALTRENQKLNSQMVLLTIAISGGPFLGLLGTVVGVMITFAAIAASGDVNVNAIAPGIAAALAATVAGLAVAIPALFGYNYLGSRIKDIAADMHVFVDEFVAKIAEQHREQ